jgi:hypothetical protein
VKSKESVSEKHILRLSNGAKSFWCKTSTVYTTGLKICQLTLSAHTYHGKTHAHVSQHASKIDEKAKMKCGL